MSTLAPFFPGATVRALKPVSAPNGLIIPPGAHGVIKGFDRACRPQVEFAGRPGLIVVCEERELAVTSI